jgi:hypothetical protein
MFLAKIQDHNINNSLKNTYVLVEVKANKGTLYKKTCMTRFSHNQDRTSMAHTNQHLNLIKIYQLQRITFSTETNRSIVNIENT